jgi:hypothetical protein
MKKKVPFLILIVVGCIVFAFTLPPVFKSVNLKKHGGSAESTVLKSDRIRSSKGSSTYNVTVSFNTPDGKEVMATVRKRFRVSNGEKVMIWYDKANPQKIDFGDSIGYNLRGAFFGGIFFFLGIYLLIRGILSDIGNKNLIKSGMKIAAEFVSVDRNEKYRMGDKNPWVIKCRWVDNRNNQEYYFVSKDYTIDPAPYLNGRYHIDVFIDPLDPRKYFMDTSFMPKGNNTIG